LRNKDTQLLVVALIFAGVFGFVGELMVRNFDGVLASRPRLSSSSDRDDRSKDGAAALIVTIIAFALIALSWGLSILARYALSQTREFMADAGAVELTKNPDALISALRKIERHSVVPGVASSMAAFFIEAPQAAGASALLSTHPTMQDRVDALVDHAGGRDLIGPPLSEPASQMETAPQAEPVSQETASQTSPQSIASAPSPAADLVGVGPRVGADLLSAPPPANSGPWGLVVPPNQTAARTARDV
jgi:heat shock protein HtpX